MADYTRDVRDVFSSCQTREQQIDLLIAHVARGATKADLDALTDAQENAMGRDEDRDDPDVDHVAGRVTGANYAGSDTGA